MASMFCFFTQLNRLSEPNSRVELIIWTKIKMALSFAICIFSFLCLAAPTCYRWIIQINQIVILAAPVPPLGQSVLGNVLLQHYSGTSFHCPLQQWTNPVVQSTCIRPRGPCWLSPGTNCLLESSCPIFSSRR